ncbi:hypothetical protein PPGU19_005570 [Paraburkholderia sp. PGU19]|uniref:hypothetical protein n=1 Tax=Paraburkholderia sp. PGU19 TaxID=2735434 RepID=UPI0015DAFFE8|nr:hypothetical protein [Paraburkholderia sp. PGU19]BCF95988.1 hypothetical protein PPGU19_005570 [Paraburkholderia sp. PGU19]
MTIKFERLHLDVLTPEGRYGAKLRFHSGLNILHAENSMGKSTCIQSIIYALGLERMLGPKAVIPLPPAMTTFLEDADGEHLVLTSDVWLEVSNTRGEALTIRRSVKGNRDFRLVTVWEGSLSEDGAAALQSRDYFLRDPGAVTHEAGFHSKLASFLGWTLPSVPRSSGGECPLYMEGIFPLFLVEQKHGWSGIQANLPTYLGIRELSKRAIEFVLKLDAASIQAERQAVAERDASLRSQWKNAISGLKAVIASTHGRIKDVPRDPVPDWPPTPEPSFEVARDGVWKPWNSAKSDTEFALDSLRQTETPTNDEIATLARTELNVSESELAEVDFAATTALEALDLESAQQRALISRISSLEEDLRRNQDAEKLRKFGSIAEWELNRDTCPTCHQHLADTLLSQNDEPQIMPLSENIEFIRAQLATFKRLQEAGSIQIGLKSQNLDSLRARLGELQGKIRLLKQTLVGASGAPAASRIRRELELETAIATLKRAGQDFIDELAEFESLAAEWRDLEVRRKALPSKELSTLDEQKLSALQTFVREQLVTYGFKSIPAESISISHDNYRPTRDGFNLGFDLSASDNIRIIWAYLEGILELSRGYATNHLGFLIFDEPRQQEAKEMSFAQLLSRTSESGVAKQQVIFATSEKWEKLKEMVSGLAVNTIRFEARVLSRID